VTIAFDAIAIADAVRNGRVSATAIAQQALRRIRASTDLLAVTRCLEDRALGEAAAVDAKVQRGEDPGPLAGVPYGVKDLFDVAGLSTTAGAARLEFADPAACDAEAIARLQAAGAVLVATLNMDEFAYGFVTDNARWGITKNPHDPACFAGGSSGGSAAAVAAGLMSFALGSDTNGSIRIPASLCGVFGIKPTHGALPMAGVYPFVHTLDDIGALARTAADLALIDGVLRDEAPAASGMVRAALLGGWFARNLTDAMQAALVDLAQGIAPLPGVDLAGVAQARSAAFVITAYEGGHLHASALRADPLSYDPATRDRLIAGAAMPDALHVEALGLRDRFAQGFDDLFARFDVLIAPVTMGPAPRIDRPIVIIDGEERPARANLGLFTQPISFLGLPVVTVPLAVPGMPIGIQLIGAKGTDHVLIAFAAELERKGLVRSGLVGDGLVS
jgi:aspartyl-tRNA(Asn)/glutamyl-tRNA(Gln) amidotransferase subunit A